MADSQNAPLTDAERAELEALRAEKAAAAAATAQAAPAQQPTSAPKPAARPAAQPAPQQPAPAEKTFGQRMVTSDATDDDGIPKMPPAQKLILLIAAALILAFIVWNITK